MKIKIGPITYKVNFYNNLMSSETGRMLHGEARHVQPEIALNKGNESDIQHLTLWHEVLHCFEAVYGDLEMTEDSVNRLSAYIVMALKENPVLRGENVDLNKPNT